MKTSTIITSALAVSALATLSMTVSCKDRPSAVELRKAEIRRTDSLELAQAQRDLVTTDSLLEVFLEEAATRKADFVFEKDDRYQTRGYYVLPAHAGSKTRLTAFPEVEEGGTLLWVAIDQKRQYSFTTLPAHPDSLEAAMPAGLSSQQTGELRQCARLAHTFQQCNDTQKSVEKLRLKVRFYEKKAELGKE